MRRDMDLIRSIMLKLEAWEKSPDAIFVVQDIENDFPIDGYTRDEIVYHYKLIADNGWVDTAGPMRHYRVITFRALTTAGHDFVDSVRDEEVWVMTRDGAKKAGAFTLELLGQLAKGFAKKQIEKHTGIEL
ncbi:DUF2513 domain-containing protein [Pseudomonas oryzihabitans]|uniref:DUF2513 domain-containing protein n=1 Tax=Pseudomonas oryzihabitans TaxID=47885 RepID=A0A1G5PIT3_9PSED|nr:DUF2513 domain-containing protein [Pseudomonas psychrotolerans]NMY92821.1 DUF2513 domain-containing protein [Pseudomonas psychrotolerans]SCZ48959.1 Hypothetical protein SAMN05216279_1434 [Pseudomonas psychrotolerans]